MKTSEENQISFFISCTRSLTMSIHYFTDNWLETLYIHIQTNLFFIIKIYLILVSLFTLRYFIFQLNSKNLQKKLLNKNKIFSFQDWNLLSPLRHFFKNLQYNSVICWSSIDNTFIFVLKWVSFLYVILKIDEYNQESLIL